MSGRVGEQDAVEAERHRDAVVDQADRLQRPQGRPGQADADAEHIPARLDFHHVDADAAAAERHRKRQPGDAAADDEDLGDARHGAAAHSGFSFAALTMSRKRS